MNSHKALQLSIVFQNVPIGASGFVSLNLCSVAKYRRKPKSSCSGASNPEQPRYLSIELTPLRLRMVVPKVFAITPQQIKKHRTWASSPL